MRGFLKDFVDFNPPEKLSIGTSTKKIAMQNILPNQREVAGYSFEIYKGGSKFRKDDVLMARITPCLENGKIAQAKLLEKEEIAFGSTEFIIWRSKPGVSDPNFLYYLATSPHIKDLAIKSMVGSSGRQRVQQSVLDNYFIDMPDLEQQHAIAAMLSCLDDKIELNNKINANLEAQVQAIFKSWFVDFEPFRDGEFVDSELGLIPKGWRVFSLGNLCKRVTKGTTPTTLNRKFTECGINFIKAESIKDNHTFDFSRFSYIDQETNALLSRSIIETNDILFTMAGTIGRFGIVDDSILPANTNQAVAIIRADSKIINPIVIYSYFIGKWHENFYSKKIQHAVQANLSLSNIKSLPILIPRDQALQKYEQLIQPLFSLMLVLSKQSGALAMLRDTLLSKLMNGEIEVPADELQKED